MRLHLPPVPFRWRSTKYCKGSERYCVIKIRKGRFGTEKKKHRHFLSVIRSVLEYACPVWHSHLHLTKYLSDYRMCSNTMDLPGDVVRRRLTRSVTGTRCAKMILALFINLYSLFPAATESEHNTCTKKKFVFRLARTNGLKTPLSHGVHVYDNFKVIYELVCQFPFI